MNPVAYNKAQFKKKGTEFGQRFHLIGLYLLQHLDLILFGALAGFASTIISYNFGGVDHLEQIPLVLRALDPEYLQNDFFVNVASQFGPRYFYSHILAVLVKFLPITYVFFGLTLLSNTLIAIISAFFSMDVLRSSRLGAMFSVCAVMALKTFSLGSVSTIYRTQLVPSLMAMPFLLGAIWAGFRGFPILLALLSGIASIFHPTLGFEVGGIGFAISIIAAYFSIKNPGLEQKRRFVQEYLASFFIFAIFLVLFLVPYLQTPKIATKEFVETLAYFRHPHFYVFSSFEAREVRYGVYFVIGTVLGLIQLYRSKLISKVTLIQFGFLYFVLVLLSVLGVLFIEIYPTRLITVIQPFRLLLLVKWLGLLLVSTLSAVYIQNQKDDSSAIGYLSILSLLTPTALFINQVFLSVREQIRYLQGKDRGNIWFGLAFVLILTYMIFFTGFGRSSSLVYLGLLTLAFIIALLSHKQHLRIITLLSLLVALPFIIQNSSKFPEPIAVHLRPYELELELQAESGELQHLSEYVNQKTPLTAVFLTPPFFGQFRITAERAILIDYRTFPFQDQAMQAWKTRLAEIYAVPTTMNYFSSAMLADESYRTISDQRILKIVREFPFDYAILYSETATELPVLFETTSYKLVQVPYDN